MGCGLTTTAWPRRCSWAAADRACGAAGSQASGGVLLDDRRGGARQLGVVRSRCAGGWFRPTSTLACGRGTTSEESAEIRKLKAENRRLLEDVEILRAATTFFASVLRLTPEGLYGQRKLTAHRDQRDQGCLLAPR